MYYPEANVLIRGVWIRLENSGLQGHTGRIRRRSVAAS